MTTPGRGYEINFPEAGKVAKGLVKSLLPDIVELVEQRARERAPRERGKLADSIESRVEEDGPRGVVAATARHAFIVHEGTASHPIVAKGGPALSIYSGGQWVLRKSAEHPGTRGQPFLTEAIEDSKAEIMQALQGNEAALKAAIANGG